MKRRIRVQHPELNAFVIETVDGLVTYCSSSDPDGYVGRDERVVAAQLRDGGATFTDLDGGESVRPARGWAARGTRGRPFSSVPRSAEVGSTRDDGARVHAPGVEPKKSNAERSARRAGAARDGVDGTSRARPVAEFEPRSGAPVGKKLPGRPKTDLVRESLRQWNRDQQPELDVEQFPF